jgi:hypothetical protein
LTAASRVHEFHAPSAMMITTTPARIAITVLRTALIVTRSSIVLYLGCRIGA